MKLVGNYADQRIGAMPVWGKAAIAGVTFITTTFAILKLRKMFSTKTDEVVRFEEVKDDSSETPDQTTPSELQMSPH